MTDIKKAKQILLSGEYTCVLRKGDIVYTSTLRGVKPLVQFIESGNSFFDFVAADKVVGKATAFLYIILGVKSIYASVISAPALDLLQKNKIEISYGTLVDYIINREGTGICPFEEAVLDVEDTKTAYIVIQNKINLYSSESQNIN